MSFCLLRDCQIIRNNLKSALEYACWLDDMSGMRRMPQQLCKERFAQILVALKRQPYIYQSYGIPVLTILQIVRSFFTQMSHPENEERNKYKFSFFCAVGKILGNIVLIFGRRELLRIETTLSVPPGGDSLQII